MSGPNLTIAQHDPLLRGQAVEPHRAARVELFGGNTDHRPQTKLDAIGKAAMYHNAATPQIVVDPETYEVRADG